MAFKLIVLCACLAVAKAGYLGAPAAYAAGPAIAAAPAALGVAYSAAPAVSSVSYSSPIVSYGAPLAAGHAIAAPAITSQSSNILRSFGNLGQVSTYSKTIDTPFSSVQKSDVRVSNPGLRIAAAAPALAYASPAYAGHAYAAPAYAGHAYAAPAYAAAAPAAIGVAYSAAPAVSHVTYAGSYGVNYGW